MRHLLGLAAALAILIAGGFGLWRFGGGLAVPAPLVRPDPVELAALDQLESGRAREGELRRSLVELQQKFVQQRAQCRTSVPTPSSLPTEVKPSMPSARKGRVDVAPAPPQR